MNVIFDLEHAERRAIEDIIDSAVHQGSGHRVQHAERMADYVTTLIRKAYLVGCLHGSHAVSSADPANES